jgi:hypothetical protein
LDSKSVSKAAIASGNIESVQYFNRWQTPVCVFGEENFLMANDVVADWQGNPDAKA